MYISYVIRFERHVFYDISIILNAPYTMFFVEVDFKTLTFLDFHYFKKPYFSHYNNYSYNLLD